MRGWMLGAVAALGLSGGAEAATVFDCVYARSGIGSEGCRGVVLFAPEDYGQSLLIVMNVTNLTNENLRFEGIHNYPRSGAGTVVSEFFSRYSFPQIRTPVRVGETVAFTLSVTPEARGDYPRTGIRLSVNGVPLPAAAGLSLLGLLSLAFLRRRSRV